MTCGRHARACFGLLLARRSLLAAGMSVRAISAETGIPVGAVNRAKRQLEKIATQGGQKAAAVSFQLPLSYVVKQDVGGVQQDVRRLTASVFERAVESAIGRGLLERSNRENPAGRYQCFVCRHVR
jgi:hypothetical protein